MTEIMHSVIQGQGEDLIILHGFLGTGDNWRTHGKTLTQMGYRVHWVDQRNHGRSFWSDDFSYEDMADDLLKYMIHHDMDKAILLGHSMGGKTAMTFATEHPEMCSKLIVIDIAPKFYPAHHQYIVDALQRLDLDDIKSRPEADAILAWSIPESSIRRWLLKNLYWETPEKFGFRFNLEVLAESMEQVGEPIASSALYTGSALFLRGEYSEYVHDTDIAMIKMHFPSAQVQTIPGAGHWVHAENPEGFMGALVPFLEGA